MRFQRLVSALALTLCTTTSWAAAFQFYELGTPIIGTAAVGQAVRANDASITYFNPAAMTELHGTQYLLGTQLLVSYNNFSVHQNNTVVGNNGGDAGALVPGLDLYYVYSVSPAWKVGLSLNSPYGGMLTYNDGWVGRYVVQSLGLLTLDLNLSAAYRFTDWLSVGVGAVAEYANLHQTLAIPFEPNNDGQLNLKLADIKPGFNIGALLTPIPGSKVGLAYRSSIHHKLNGNTTFLRLNLSPTTTTKMIMPQNVILSLSQDVNERFTVLAEGGWADWSTMQSTIVNIYGFNAVTPRKWHDTYRAGLAGVFHFTPDLLIQAGGSFDSSPTSAANRLPDLPMDRQIRGGLGVIYTVFHTAQLGFSYEYMNLGHAGIDHTSLEGVLSGAYTTRNYANAFQASINVGC